MSQRLSTKFRKGGKARGVAIRKTKSTKKKSILSSLFSLAYQQHVRKNGKSKSKTS